MKQPGIDMIRICPMTAHDVPVIMKIEQESQIEPWSRESFLEELAHGHSYCFVARCGQGGEGDRACERENPPGPAPNVVDLSHQRHPGESRDPGFMRLLDPGFRRDDAKSTALGPAPGGEIAGYICFWHVVDEIQILNIAVGCASRGRGIGRMLLLHSLQWGRERKAKMAFLEVRKSNLGARYLYESVGFKVCGERPDYYSKDEPAVLMALELKESR